MFVECQHAEQTVTLWSNEDVTANFQSQTITLDSGYFSSYSSIEIEYVYAASNTDPIKLRIPYSQLVASVQTDTVTGPAIFLGIRNGANTKGYRIAYYVSDNEILFGAAYLINSTTAYQNFAIPSKIYGIR